MASRDPGSFRDPSGYVFIDGDQVWRSVNPRAADEFQALHGSGLLDELQHRGLLIRTEVVAPDSTAAERFIGARGERPALLLRHPRIRFISYPYEWTFSQLKAAALAHLDLQLAAFDKGFALSDATPFNMQFDRAIPVHIDVLSIRRYREGEVWAGYHQFSRQFLMPLLLEAWRGVPFQPWLRGRIEGIPVGDAARLLPWRKRWLTLNGLLHVSLLAGSESGSSSSRVSGEVTKASLPRARYRAMLAEMRRWIEGLRSGRPTRTFWHGYAAQNSYSRDMQAAKLDFVARAVSRARAAMVWDLGGNSGDYSVAALEAGAQQAICFDSDHDALERAYERAITREPGLLPLHLDCADPTPSLGWRAQERRGFHERRAADLVLALALVHHLAIGRNVPLADVVDWLTGMAPEGVVEFVPKSDPMVQGMLRHRDDVFADYDEETFRAGIEKRADILDEFRFAENGRWLVHFKVRA